MSNLTGRPIYEKGMKPAKVPTLRKSAMGETCTLRLPGCLHSPETVVAAHMRFFNAAGMGQKPDDIFTVFACAHCHDALDRRAAKIECGWDDILRAFMETLRIRRARGEIVLSGE